MGRVTAEEPCGASGLIAAWVVSQSAFKETVAIHGAKLGIDVEVAQRAAGERGFRPQPKRWVIEQTFGTLMLHRRLVRDYETLPASAISRIYRAMTVNMIRRLTGTATITWRAPPTGVPT